MGSSSRVPRGTRFRKPFIVPDTLEELRGPVTGLFTIPKRLYWPRPQPVTVDLSQDGEKTVLYSAVMTEGTLADLRTMVNAEELVRLWDRIGLSPLIMQAWENKLPRLQGGVVHSG